MVEAGIKPRTFSSQNQALSTTPSAASLLHVSQTSKVHLVSSGREAGLFQGLRFSFLYSFKQCELPSAVARPGAGPKVPRSAPLHSSPGHSPLGLDLGAVPPVCPGMASSLCKLWCPRAMSKERQIHPSLVQPVTFSGLQGFFLLCQHLSPAPSSPGKSNGSRIIQDSTVSPAFAKTAPAPPPMGVLV